eukprot:CAMPEP_0182910598 /NCGR_PEP_ID=MMETSP0034_2-20130328/36416_1 /TAXON_ID=156128 /ORGANISM="Nephroselmis pyriformis, Strain CCMP717" /LENGTH=47 /DNA_ID= /DNA_START= /DNA_END= /DNA_ORIENTATION=
MRYGWEKLKVFMDQCYPQVNVSIIRPVGLKNIGWTEVSSLEELENAR